MTQLVDLTLTLGSERVAPVPGLVGVSMEPLHTHESHARSNTKLLDLRELARDQSPICIADLQ